ncbi:hypothetical protein H5410_063985 [Solanum commersonii]|uniref:Uncharacterized protein n=1 Tax=Solanum commersonii TaxID=4109 RepID=A0A9J5W0E7_SOLCO|nr:hypothetical protein H5410_063985 [Solanum commersonii]
MRPRLNWPGRGLLRYFEEIRVLKASLRLYTLAWDNIIGFRSYYAGLRIGVMINTGHSDFIVENESRGSRRIDTALVSTYKRCRTVDRRMLLLGLTAPYEKSKFWVPGSMVARLKLKGIDGRAPPEGARA